MLFYLLLTAALAQVQPMTQSHVLSGGVIKESISALFSDKFSCFQDVGGVYQEYSDAVYNANGNIQWYCCGLMANGRRQCDRMEEWKQIGDTHFALCETDYNMAMNTDGGRMRRDMCCQNDDFNDCGLCKSFMVWDFTVDGEPDANGDGIPEYYGGDNILERSLADTRWPANAATPAGDGKVTLSETWREHFNKQPQPEYIPSGTSNVISYPPYAYDNEVYPAGFARGTLREYNDPPVCVYAPNVAGRVIEVRVEPEESGSQVCVDDLHEDSLERNTPGVTQACDDSKLQTCFPDATADGSIDGFAFLISCSESCADGPVDLWFRLRASVMKWTDAGDESKGTDRTEVNTEMWCMWGNQDMRDAAGDTSFPDAFPQEIKDNGDFSKWDVFPSDLAPEEDPVVFPARNGVSMISITALLSILALLLF